MDVSDICGASAGASSGWSSNTSLESIPFTVRLRVRTENHAALPADRFAPGPPRARDVDAYLQPGLQTTASWRETALPPLTFGYTRPSIRAKRIQKFESRSVPPPALSEDVTLLDFRGSSLPGVLRMDGNEPMYWENRGRLSWSLPEPLRGLPQGVRLGQDSVWFADLTGNGTADSILSTADGDSYFPNDPDHGILARRRALLAPDFGLGEEGSWLLDIDGDRVADSRRSAMASRWRSSTKAESRGQGRRCCRPQVCRISRSSNHDSGSLT